MFGWRSDPAITRIKEALSEIKALNRKAPMLAAEGAVLFLLKRPRHKCPYPSWAYRQWGAKALVAMGTKTEALRYAEANDAKLYGLALKRAQRSAVDYRTRIRSTQNFVLTEPQFELNSGLLALDWICADRQGPAGLRSDTAGRANGARH